MHPRPLGATGLTVTPIGLGLAAVGRPAYITSGRATDLGTGRDVDDLRRRSHELLDAAVAAGVRYVDVARSYGLAESFLGAWLETRDPALTGGVAIGSKWGYTYVGQWRLDAPIHEVKDHGLAALERQLAESRAILGDRLALYQVHSATLESGVLDDPAVLGRLAALRAEGVVVGLSVSGPRQGAVIERALETRVDGIQPFAEVQATWNLLEPSAGPALAAAHDAGWGVIVKEAVANGRLAVAGQGVPALETVARRLGATPDAVAMAAVLARPWVDVVLSGAASLQHLASNLRAAALRLDPADLDALSGLAEPPDAYWSARAARAWA